MPGKYTTTVETAAILTELYSGYQSMRPSIRGTKGTGDFVQTCGDSPTRHHILGQNPPSLLSQSRYAVASGVKPTSLKHLEASAPLRNSRKSLAPSACGAFFIAAAG